LADSSSFEHGVAVSPFVDIEMPTIAY